MQKLGFMATPSENINKFLGGGIPYKEVTSIFGRGGTTKTFFAVNLMFGVIKNGGKVIYLNFEKMVDPEVVKLVGEKILGGKLPCPDAENYRLKDGRYTKTSWDAYCNDFFKNLEQFGIYYYLATDYNSERDIFADNIGSLVKTQVDGKDKSILTTMLSDNKIAILQKVDLVIIDSFTWYLIPQILSSTTAMKNVMSWLLEAYTILTEQTLKYGFGALCIVQSLSEIKDKLVDESQLSAIEKLRIDADGRDYCGGKAVDYGSSMILEFIGKSEERFMNLVKHPFKKEGEKINFHLEEGKITHSLDKKH